MFITLFSGRCLGLAMLAFYNPQQTLQKCGPKLIAEPNEHVLTFLHPILICRVAH
jgi:hypothetical protein